MNMGEREMPTIPGTIEGIDAQHIQRYEFARPYCSDVVIDVACGCGYGSRILYGSSRDYFGIDCNEEAIAYAQKYYDDLPGSGLARNFFMVGDAEKCDEVFDSHCEVKYHITHIPSECTTVSFETIEHLNDPHSFLQWAKNSSTRLIISTPIAESCPKSPFHIKEYSIAEFEQMLRLYYQNIQLFVQDGLTIRCPVQANDKGNLIAVCWR